MAYDFSGKVALVTGSSSGIGRDLVIAFAKAGACVVVTGRSAERVEQVTQEVLQVSKVTNEQKVLSVIADLAKEEDAQKLIDETISTFGQLDILVNNVGELFAASIMDEDFMDKLHNVMKTNVHSYLQVTRLAVPFLIETKGNIINISSVASLKPSPQFATYNISKTVVDMITTCLCLELSPKGVRVNTVNPALIVTPFMETNGLDRDKLIAMQKYPIGRVGQVADTTAACLYLASKEASFITGIKLPVDGGFILT